jgi:integrase
MSIRERRPGIWEVSIWGHARPDGTRPRKSKTVYGGKRAARAAERNLLTARDKGKLDLKTPTLATYATLWQDDKAKEVGPKTKEKHAYALARILPALGKLRLASVNTIALRHFKDTLTASPELSGTTQRMVWDILSQILKRAAHEGYIQGNPCALVTPPAKDTAERKHLTKKQVVALRKALAENPRVLIAADLMLATAARPGEALALTWPDIDLEHGTVRLTATKTAHQTKAGERTVPLTAAMVKALKQHRSEQNRARLKAGDKWTGDFVFPSRLGRPWTVTAYRQAWNKAGGNEHCTPYSLRHTCITHWIQAGMRLALVSQLAGHAQQTTTANTYSHTDKSELEDARAIMEGMVSA